MRSWTLIVSVVMVVCGCARPAYVTGQGDAGQFMLKQAVAHGGRPLNVEGLSAVDGPWQYVQDEFGVGVLLPAGSYEAARNFLQSAFGPSSGQAGWSVRDVGVAIYLNRNGTNTFVGIHPPMSEEQQGRAFRKMTETIEENIKPQDK